MFGNISTNLQNFLVLDVPFNNYGNIDDGLSINVEPDFDDIRNLKLYNDVARYLSSDRCNNIFDFINAQSLDLDKIHECFDEVKSLSQIGFAWSVGKLTEGCNIFDNGKMRINLNFDSINKMFTTMGEKCECNATHACISVFTIGSKVDQRIELYKGKDLSKMVFFNACASAFAEYANDIISDEFFEALREEGMFKEKTFRFAPGYGKVPLSLQREIFDLLSEETLKIDVDLCDNLLMKPIKSISGITGLR